MASLPLLLTHVTVVLAFIVKVAGEKPEEVKVIVFCSCVISEEALACGVEDSVTCSAVVTEGFVEVRLLLLTMNPIPSNKTRIIIPIITLLFTI